MKLLICTQIVDKNDPILGFFHRWVEEFAEHFEHVSVICLREGTHTLPENVSVYSLGKEGGESWFKYISRFYKYLFLLRGTYDRVFVHMNPHYVMLGGIFWACTRRPIYFWRNHARMNSMTQIAAQFARLVFYTSPFACTSRYAHARQMPVGIDTRVFVTGGGREVNDNRPKKILFLGRLSPVKRVELFIEASKFMPKDYEFHIYGDAPLKDSVYGKQIKEMAGENVFFHPGVPNDATPEIYRAHDVYVNFTPEGSMDKTVLEAASCGSSVLVSNTSFKNILSDISIISDGAPQSIAKRIVLIIDQTKDEKEKNQLETRSHVVEKHSLEKLATMLYNYME